MSFLINKFWQRLDGPVSISKGNPIDLTEILQRSNDARILMQFLRQKIYELAKRPIDLFANGFEFEQGYKTE